ncbi:uncharacterized protein LOC134444063 [Engraulis encrasicolus]|uniref:uncharacterized protein LOC134444063 n=1 Tax=Engraulis encrasicolus TaxID=184585 RepID=UPI002FD36D30
MASSAEDIIETAALGRPFTLGMLYDCRKDFLVPGITLWNYDDLQKNTRKTTHQNTEFNITASDSIDEKSNSLNVSGSLKLSLLGGLVNVSGSAKYFQDTKKSHKQQRLTLNYKTTTRYEALTMSHLGRGKVSHPNVFEDRTATHVVTAILYGASAYFMFDRESSNDEDKKHVEGEAKLMMDKLKFIKISAEASFDMDEREKCALEKFSCTFHGDFHLTSNPSSFIEAMNVYRQLPKLLGEDGEHAVPVRVWMYPLVKLDSKAAKLQREISNSLITYTSGVIEDLNETEMRCNDLLKDTEATTFSAMKEKLQTFMQNCRHYKVEFVQKLGSVLPSIRGGVQEERDLADILKAHEKSPFNSKDLVQWLTVKEKESETITPFLKQLEKLGAKLDDNLDGLLSDLDITNIVSFTFTSIDQPDSSLMKQSHFLSPAGMMNECPESDTLQNRNTEWISADTRQTMRKQLQQFKHLKEQLDSSDDTKFIVASKYDERFPGACIFIYEDGSDEPVPFTPPSKPATPTTSDVSYHRLTVGVSDPDSATVEHRVEFRMKSEWISHPVQKNEKTVTLSGLKPDTEYEIRVTAVGKLGYSISSDAITVKTTISPPTEAKVENVKAYSTNIGPPTNVKVIEKKANSITLSWLNPENCEGVEQYLIEYKEEHSSRWQKQDTKKEMYKSTLKNLKLNTSYSIRMRTDAKSGMSDYGDILLATTREGPQDKKRFTMLPSGNPPVTLPVYGLNLQKATTVQFRKMEFGKPKPLGNPPNKTIMFVGATGSGKTTLINGIINYVLGVDWDNDWRFKLIDEDTQKTQAHSQTSAVTAYQIYHTDEFQVPYSLTIIDTPGFGDTRGIKHDKEITDQIKQFFTNKDGIDAIDAVCFVVQAALARLTHTQRYIFDAILSVFGKDIASNIITLVTFADAKTPPVLAAIKEADIPCAKQKDGTLIYFKFNNSALFANNIKENKDGKDSSDEDKEEDFDYMFWKMGKSSLKKFFTHLKTMTTQSLSLTKEVLQERDRLEATVEGLQPLIQKGLSKMEEIRTTEAALDKHKNQVEENRDFEYEVEVEKPQKIDIPRGEYITNCLQCTFTCHRHCRIPKDEDKRGCVAIGSNGYCTVCPGKCIWNIHHNMEYRFETQRVKEKRTYQNLKTKFEEALGEQMTTEKMMSQLNLEYELVQEEVVEMMNTVNACLTRLKDIALRPDPLSTTEYIDLMIQSEKQECRPGYNERIQELTVVRQKAVVVQKMAKSKPGLKGRTKRVFSNIVSWFTE